MMRKIIRLIIFTALIISFIIQTAHALDQQVIVLEGAAADYRRIDLYWDAPGTAATSEELVGKYEVYKDGQLFKQYEQEYINQKHYISHSSCDYPVEERSTHSYYVRAYDINGDFVGQSNTITVTTPAKYTYDYLPAFPGAEGFGACATGGRGGRVVYVTNLNSSGPGSLRDALTQTGPRYILFKVSGIISLDGWWNMNGDYTLAGHSSEGGVITRGYITSTVDNPDYTGMTNVIIRHLRSRPDGRTTSWPSGYTPTDDQLSWGTPGGWDDAFRLINTSKVILDHCSFGRAGDETMQVASSNFITIQNTILAEAIGSHYSLGGMLINYTGPESPLNNLSIHHNMWNRVGGRLPEISNNAGYANDHVFNFEISNNLIWDPAATIWVNTRGVPYNPQDDYYLHMNMVGSYMKTRDDFRHGIIVRDILSKGYSLFLSDNQMSLYPQYADYQIVYGNNDFYRNHPNTYVGQEERKTERHPYAPITYTDSDNLIDYMIENVGAFPRDTMDRRLIGYLENNEIDPTPLWARPANDGLTFDWQTPPPPPLDSDDDGMPDWWELHNGLDPLAQDHNGKDLSVLYTGVAGYDNLEVYLNRLSDNLVDGRAMTEGNAHIYPVSIQNAAASKNTIVPGQDNTVTFSVTPANPDSIVHVELSLDMLNAPYASPSPLPVAAVRNGNVWTYTWNVPSDRDPGKYQVLVHATDQSGQDGYSIINLNISQDGAAGSPPSVQEPNWPLRVISWDVNKAYPGVDYEYRLGVQGGKYPYDFKLVDAPAGMKIQKNTGIITWKPETESSNNQVSVEITDRDGRKITHSYLLDVNRSDFRFVASNGNDANAGTEESPWATLEHAVKTATNSKYIYVKQGSYPVDFSIQNNDCGKLLAYPGHEVTLIGSGNGNSRISLKGAGEYIFQGFNCDVNSTRWFFSVDTSLLSNLIIRKNNMFNIDDSSRENPAFMFFWDGSKKPINGEEHYKNIIVQENIFHDLRNTNNHGASVVLYDVQDMIYEDNIIYDIDGNGIIDKDDGFRNTFRNNLIYDCLTGIALLNQYSQGSIDVCYNLVYNCDKAAVIGAQPGYLKDVFLHHNTLIDGISFGAVLNRNSNCSNINVYNNVIGRHGDEYPYQFVPIKVMDTETAYHYEYPAYVQDPSDETVRIDKNLIWVKSENDISGYGWGLTKMNLTQWHNAMYDSNGIVADPGLDTDYSLPLTSGYYGEYGRDNEFIRTAGVSVQQVQDTNIYYVSPDATSTDWAAARNINSPCTIQTAFDNAQAGDTVQFRGGIYNVPVRSSGTWLTGYYAPNHSGTEEAPIVFMAYPGETPVFDGKQGGVDRDGHGYYHHATIMSNARYTGSGTSFHEYITFDGFTFQCDGGVNEARIALTGGDNYFKGQRVRGLVVQNCTFNGGTWDNEARINGVGGTGDNHEGIFISQVTGLVIRNCRIFDYNHTQNNQNTSGIKTYHSDNVIIENCEIFDCTRGIYSKSNTDDLTVRYNYIHDCNEGFFAGTSGWWNDANDHTKGYHVSENSNNVLHNNLFTNIKRGPVSGFTQDGGDLDRMVIYNNTIYADTGYTASIGLGCGERQQFFNNIQYGPKVDGDIGLLRWYCGDNNPQDIAEGKAEYNFGLDSADHNQFGNYPGSFLIRVRKPNSTAISYNSLAAWQASGILTNGGDPGEGDLVSDPLFVNGSGTMKEISDFALQTGSPCKGAGRNGIDMGADISRVGIQSSLPADNSGGGSGGNTGGGGSSNTGSGGNAGDGTGNAGGGDSGGITNGGGNNNAGGGGNPPSTVTPPPAIIPEQIPAETSYEATVLGHPNIKSLLGNVDSASNKFLITLNEAQAKSLLRNMKKTTISIPAIPGVKTYALELPVTSLQETVKRDYMTILTEAGKITIPNDLLKGLNETGSTASISIGIGDKTHLGSQAKSIIGDSPLVQISLSVDGKEIYRTVPSPVTVSIPYTPSAEELKNPEDIVIWAIDQNGNVTVIPNGHYDALTKTITFKANSFSQFTVGTIKTSFIDVPASAWYAKAVRFAAARGIASGVGNNRFDPDGQLTRAQVLVMIMRAYGIAPDSNTSGNFKDAGNTWYTGYLAAAKRLGITKGIGNNMFGPDNAITRQEMCALLYNTLKFIGELPEEDTSIGSGTTQSTGTAQSTGTNDNSLKGFADTNLVADWAREAMAALLKSGAINGSNGKLTPTAKADRAQMVQILYNLLSK